MGWNRPVAVALIAISLTSCSDADRATADLATQAFHQQFNAGQFVEIYTGATQEFRAATSQTDWVALLDALRRRAGAFQSTKQTSWLVNSGTAGTTVTATYSTTFAQLITTERFSWRIQNGTAILLGYRVDAPDVLTN